MNKTLDYCCTCRLLLVVLLVGVMGKGRTQYPYNLVPNPSFEVFNISCSNIIPGIGGAVNWYNPVINSKDSYSYTNACSTNPCCGVPYDDYGLCYQEAHSGVAFISLPLFYKPNSKVGLRQYLQTVLLNKLIINKCYYIEFYINRMDFYKLVHNNISLLVGDTAVISDSGKYIHAIPQIQQFGNPIISDSVNWVKIGGVYTAHGGEQYITIGNFADEAHTDTLHLLPTGIFYESGYYIDDVSVIPLDSMQLKADAGKDTTIVMGDSVWIGSRLCGLQNVVWYDAYNNVIDTGAPGLWVKPTTNTFYVIEQNVCGQYSRDTVSINVQALPVVLKTFTVQEVSKVQGFNTNTEVSWVTANEINTVYFNIQRSVDGNNFWTIGIVNAKGASGYKYIDNTNLTGVVYYRLEIVDKNGSKTYSEVKELSIINYQLSINFTRLHNTRKHFQ